MNETLFFMLANERLRASLRGHMDSGARKVFL